MIVTLWNKKRPKCWKLSVTQGKKERQLWRQKHSTVQGQSQPIECRFFFVLCSFTLSAALCLVPVGISRIVSFWLDGEVTKTWSRVCMSYFDLMTIYLELFIIEYECESGDAWFSVVQPNALWVSLERAPTAWERLRSLMQKGARRSDDQWSRGEFSCKRAVITSNQSWLPSSSVNYRVDVVYSM